MSPAEYFGFGKHLIAQQLHSLLPRISYKPGWSFAIRAHGGINAEFLEINVSTWDADDVSKQTFVAHQIPLPAHVYDVPHALSFIRYAIDQVERHESREFLRLDGEQVDPPHHGPGSDPYA